MVAIVSRGRWVNWPSSPTLLRLLMPNMESDCGVWSPEWCRDRFGVWSVEHCGVSRPDLEPLLAGTWPRYFSKLAELCTRLMFFLSVSAPKLMGLSCRNPWDSNCVVSDLKCIKLSWVGPSGRERRRLLAASLGELSWSGGPFREELSFSSSEREVSWLDSVSRVDGSEATSLSIHGASSSTYRGRWINSLRPSDANMRHKPRPSLVQIMACRLAGAKPLSETMPEYC